jgi:hypothetical protein
MNKQSKWLIGLVALLVVVNLALVASIWLKKEKDVRPKVGDAKDYLVEQLSMTPSQVRSFDSLRKGHFERMRKYQDEMKYLKETLFNQLKETSPQHDLVARKIGELQTRIDLETFDHFSRLRSSLSEEQKKKFDNIIQIVLRSMAPGGGPLPGFRPGEEGPPPGVPPH